MALDVQRNRVPEECSKLGAARCSAEPQMQEALCSLCQLGDQVLTSIHVQACQSRTCVHCAKWCYSTRLLIKFFGRSGLVAP